MTDKRPLDVENRGWGEYVEPAEYEARRDAMSPKPANGEAEAHVPPTPQGKVRAIPKRRDNGR